MSLLSLPSSSSAYCLDGDDVHLWLIEEGATASHPLTETYAAQLSQAEQARAQTMRSATRRHQFILARAGLRTLLSHYVPGVAATEFDIVTSAQGKPGLATPALGLQFNLSHSGNRILIGITRHRHIGVDIECMAHPRDYARLAAHYFHEEEWNSHELDRDANAGIDSRQRFYTLWTLKEAFMKAEGAGLSVPINSLCFRDIHSPSPRLSQPAPLTNKAWQFRTWLTEDHYTLALAIEDSSPGAAITAQLRHAQFA